MNYKGNSSHFTIALNLPLRLSSRKRYAEGGEERMWWHVTASVRSYSFAPKPSNLKMNEEVRRKIEVNLHKIKINKNSSIISPLNQSVEKVKWLASPSLLFSLMIFYLNINYTYVLKCELYINLNSYFIYIDTNMGGINLWTL